MIYDFMSSTWISTPNLSKKDIDFMIEQIRLEEWHRRKGKFQLYECGTNKLVHNFVVKRNKNGEYYIYDTVKRKRYKGV